jgi:hypothetical protein
MPQTQPDGNVGFEVSSSFIGFFKDGDNIVYNLAILQALYDALESTPPERRVLITKPIVVQIACVAEAVLVDLALRTLLQFKEGVPNIPPATLLVLRAKVEKSKQKLTFRRLISILEQSNVFDEEPSFYARLVELATRRNRVHISNRGGMAPADEGDLFLEQTRIDAEMICEELVKTCAARFTRGKYFTYVKPFRFPWAPHCD